MLIDPLLVKNAIRLSHYTISNDTEAIFDYNYKGLACSIIFENHYVFLIKKKPLRLIRESCRHYGWSYRERIRQTKEYFQHAHKLPILMTYTPRKPCILFPLYSPTTNDNAWLNVYAIRGVKKIDEYCEVTLRHRTLPLPATINVFKTQYTMANLFARNCELNY
ncbi:MAG: competence protein ComK [Caryophanon sp.]|nr:competence protein ComK [Caryophanon sp.]